MKTKTTISSLILALSILFSININASNNEFTFEEENYIDDIPFNTELLVLEMPSTQFDFEEEAVIDDIPFNTGNIVINYNFELALNSNFNFPEEEQIDDIPFKTSIIACNQTSTCMKAATYVSN